MKDTYHFSKGKRGRVMAEPPPEPGKVRITIRLDEEQFGPARIRRGEDPKVGRDPTAHHPRGDEEQ